MKKVYYFTNLAPHYRSRLWTLLAQMDNAEFNFAFGDSYAKSEIKTINFKFPPFKQERLHKLKNISFNNILYWQRGTLRILFTQKIDIAIFLGDMNVISNWIGAIICKLRGTKVIYWGHGFSGSERKFKKFVRICFNKLADHFLLYGNHAKDLMLKYGFNQATISVVYNSIDYDETYRLRATLPALDKFKELSFFKTPSLPTLVFTGRLSKVKKLELLIKAIHKLNVKSIEYNLLIIGDGDQMDYLRKISLYGIQMGYIHFFGACYEESKLSKLMGLSDLCLSPGNVGLTAIHSLSYGTPVGSHNNINQQMPEFEAIVEGKTGFFFNEDDLKDLLEKIHLWFKQNTNREKVRNACFQIIDDHYNPYYQVEVFKKALSDLQ